MAEEEQTAGGTNADPAGVSLALHGASRAEADAYLRDQRHHLAQDEKQIGLKLWELRVGVALRVATLVVGLGVAAGLGFLVWDAAHSKGLIVEPFSVPADLAQRGLTGEVIASQMIDKLAHMTKSESSRAVQSYANNWDNNIKVEIPETGISIGELRNFLREWLGHDIHSSGEIYRTATGIAVTARAGSDEGATFTGKESDLDALVQQAAEHVYEVTQPYRYANYLDRNYDPKGVAQRVAKATAIYRKLIAGDDVKEQAWAWNGLATIQFNFYADNRKASWYYRKALATDPDMTLVYYALSARNGPLGQEEEAYRSRMEFIRRAERGTPELNPRYTPGAMAQAKGDTLSAVGDFAPAIAVLMQAAESVDNFSVLARGNYIIAAFNAMLRRHDPAAARAYLKALGWTQLPVQSRFWDAMNTDDWRSALASEESVNRVTGQLVLEKHITLGDAQPAVWPPYAYAHARTGDIAGAERLLAALTDDNTSAVRMRAMVAEVKGDRARADWWFARSEAQTPSIPLTDLWWGQALLKRGQPDAAIVKFARANQLGPKFADPLEYWGEALMAKNQSHLALEKFAEAEKYAPNWGRLHLKWGEALYYAGKRDEARAQFARAAALDLTPSEKSELARLNHV